MNILHAFKKKSKMRRKKESQNVKQTETNDPTCILNENHSLGEGERTYSN
jgi:hypothetical protein